MFFIEIIPSPYVCKEKHHINIQQDCTNCGAHESVYIVPVFMSTSIFMLPLFPTSFREYLIRCKSCGKEGGNYYIDSNVIRKIRAPLYLYSGSIILVILLSIIILFVTIEQKTDRTEKLMEAIVNPKVNRSFLVKVSDEKNVFYTTTKVEGDSIFFRIADPDLHKEYREREEESLKLDKQPGEVFDFDYYYPTIVYTIEDLKMMLRNGDIIESVL